MIDGCDIWDGPKQIGGRWTRVEPRYYVWRNAFKTDLRALRLTTICGRRYCVHLPHLRLKKPQHGLASAGMSFRQARELRLAMFEMRASGLLKGMTWDVTDLAKIQLTPTSMRWLSEGLAGVPIIGIFAVWSQMIRDSRVWRM